MRLKLHTVRVDHTTVLNVAPRARCGPEPA